MSDALDDYKASWLRILLSIVGNDENARRGMELAELNGLFDPIVALRSQGGKAEPDAWLVGWHSANGDAGTSVYTTEDEARRAAKNMEAYRSSETMTDVLPLYAAPLPSPPECIDWRPIDAAPRDGTRILAAGGGLERIEIVSYNERVACWDAESCTLDDRDNEAEGYSRPTKWAPLPSFPREESHG